MATQRRFRWWTAAIGLVLCAGLVSAWGNGDHNGDGTIDLEDYAEMPGCMTGPGSALGTGCEVFDFDGDVDVDVSDLARFQRIFGTTITLPDMVPVPAGEFEMGGSLEGARPHEQPVQDVYLDAYYIDVYEVTNQLYADALNWVWGQGGLIHVTNGVVYQHGGTTCAYCSTTAGSSGSRINWDGSVFTVAAGKENHPMTAVNWHGAAAFCNWRSVMEGRTPCYDLATWTCDFEADGFRLPTEAEWEKAAGWDPDLAAHFRFSEHTNGCGSDCLDGQRANYYDSGDPFEAGAEPRTTPVGFYNGELHSKEDFGWPGSGESYQTQDARSYYGCRDMSGNVWEWCHDWYDTWYYSSSPPYDNPTGPASGTDRVLRGGHSEAIPFYCRSASRGGAYPTYRNGCGGFRCVSRGSPFPTVASGTEDAVVPPLY